MSVKILIVGAGAIGSFYGSLLAREGQQVSMVVRSDYDVVKAHGIHVESTLGSWDFKPHHRSKNSDRLSRASQFRGFMYQGD